MATMAMTMDIMAILMAMDTIITIMDITIVIGMITTTGDETAHWAIRTTESRFQRVVFRKRG